MCGCLTEFLNRRNELEDFRVPDKNQTMAEVDASFAESENLKDNKNAVAGYS